MVKSHQKVVIPHQKVVVASQKGRSYEKYLHYKSLNSNQL